jgi:integrase
MRGIRRRVGVAPVQKAPATALAIAAMLEHIPDTLIGRRDRALLLIGFAAAQRRSEIAALQVSDVERVADGLIIHVRKSKTDQEGAGAQIPIPRGDRLKPVDALEAWSRARRSPTGPCSCQSARAIASAGSGCPITQSARS